MLFDLTASDTSPLSLSEENVAALAACGRPTTPVAALIAPAPPGPD